MFSNVFVHMLIKKSFQQQKKYCFQSPGLENRLCTQISRWSSRQQRWLQRVHNIVGPLVFLPVYLTQGNVIQPARKRDLHNDRDNYQNELIYPFTSERGQHFKYIQLSCLSVLIVSSKLLFSIRVSLFEFQYIFSSTIQSHITPYPKINYIFTFRNIKCYNPVVIINFFKNHFRQHQSLFTHQSFF